MNKKTRKKAQVTLFIIIGIVILLGVITVIYISSQRTKVTEGEIIRIQDVPVSFRPIVNYATKCLEDTAVIAFKKIGEHGGYIDPDDIYLSERAFSIEQDPTESDALHLGDQDVVYWWYMESQNNCIDCTWSSLIPTIGEIEDQVDRYIEREMRNCIAGFRTFTDQGFEVTEENIEATTTINEQDVQIALKYPLKVKRGDAEFEISNFGVTLNLRFTDVYSLALGTTIEQMNKQYLEEIILHLISLYSYNLDPNLIPPIFASTTSNNIITWRKDKVHESLKKEVLPHLMETQIKNTRDAVRITAENPLEQGAYDLMFLDLFGQKEFPHMSANFLYASEWPIHFRISPPTNGNILEPTVHDQDYVLGIVPSTQFNTYEFFYDLAIPLLITIKDDKSLTDVGEAGYTFMFALEANIRDNKVMQEIMQGRGTQGPVDYSQVLFSYNDVDTSQGNCTAKNPRWTCPADGKKFTNSATCSSSCNDITCPRSYTSWECDDGNSFNSEADCVASCTSQTDQRVTQSTTKSLSCEIYQSGDIEVNVNDRRSTEKIEDVAIRFRCGNDKQCPIGSTNSTGSYTSRFPLCIGDGFLTLEKEGYVTKVHDPFSINRDESKTINVELEPLKSIEVEAVYINVTNLFRIKRKLVTLDNHIVDLVEDAITTHIWIPPLNYLLPFPDDKLSKSEANTILKDIKPPRATAKNLTKDIKYAYQTNRTIVRATKLIKKATTGAYNLAKEIIDNPNYIDAIIGRDFTGNINIDNNVLSTLQEDIRWLDKELENIEFLEDNELVSTQNIQKYRNQAKKIKSREQAIISATKKKDTQYEQNLPLPEVIIEGSSTSDIELVPGIYEVNIKFMDLNGMTLPNPGGGVKHYPIALLGGAEINNITRYWIVDEDELYNNNKVRFYFLKTDKPRDTEEFQDIDNIEERSKRYREFIEPEFLP